MKVAFRRTFPAWLVFISFLAYAQPDRWQQRIAYDIQVNMDAENHQFTAVQSMRYTNNSPDTLNRLFIHLYFNAFQPNSMMDVRSRTIADPDPRVGERIFNLKEEEIGYHKINSFTVNGQETKFEIEGTVMEITLADPILPGETATVNMTYNSQVPLQVRRSGRDNKEGIEFSMAQWYPKMAEYDYKGWHAHPYIGREFYAPWGDFNVSITMDSKYIIAGTGVLQNAEEIGYGYAERKKRRLPARLTWNFKAENVHDFVWAADPDYVHDQIKIAGNGPTIHFFYQPSSDEVKTNWKRLQEDTKKFFPYIEENFGEYPYSTYSVIQGGDGGMEYPMATLITGERPYGSLLGVTVHEIMHTWYQMLLATNESYYAWMDEGFTSYTSTEIMDWLAGKEPSLSGYSGYFRIVGDSMEEALSTHADHFTTNRAYSTAAYGKGAVSLRQLGYVIGDDVMRKGLLRYYNTWRFKHPNLNDFVRVMEKESGLELDWYYEYWVNTTHTIDYGLRNIQQDGSKYTITLERVGKMPMPIDLEVTFADGSKQVFYIPLGIMRGEKKPETDLPTTVLDDWPWTHPYYEFTINGKQITRIEIDPSQRMADTNRENNVAAAQ